MLRLRNSALGFDEVLHITWCRRWLQVVMGYIKVRLVCLVFFLKEIKWASAPSIHSCVCCTYTWCFCVKKASLLRLRKCLGWIFLQTLAQTHTWTRMNWLGFGGWGVQRSRLPHDILWYELRCANSDECDVVCCVQKVFCGRDTEGFVTWPKCVSLTGRFKRCYKPSSLEYAMFNSGLSCSCI